MFHLTSRPYSAGLQSRRLPTGFTWPMTNETTFGAARRLIADGRKPLALNFANGIQPGGGFLGGARAQEEVLCRSSALYRTLTVPRVISVRRWKTNSTRCSPTSFSPSRTGHRKEGFWGPSARRLHERQCQFAVCFLRFSLNETAQHIHVLVRNAFDIDGIRANETEDQRQLP
jgi:Uncharacterized protein conserved in bacteria (DUF2263)